MDTIVWLSHIYCFDSLVFEFIFLTLFLFHPEKAGIVLWILIGNKQLHSPHRRIVNNIAQSIQSTDMPNLTIAISDELKARIEEHPELNWSGVLRQQLEEKLRDMAKEENKGEVVAKLERVLFPAQAKKEADIQKTKKEETERFATKWGEQSRSFPTQQKPYLHLSKSFQLILGPSKAKKLEVTNQSDWEKTYSPYIQKPEPKQWDEVTASIIEAFDSIDFKIRERELIGEELGYVYPEKSIRERRETARDLLQRYKIFGLFAYDNEDTVYIGHRQEKR